MDEYGPDNFSSSGKAGGQISWKSCVEDLFQVFYNCRGRRKEPVFHAGWREWSVMGMHIVIFMLLFTMKANNALGLVSLDHGISI